MEPLTPPILFRMKMSSSFMCFSGIHLRYKQKNDCIWKCRNWICTNTCVASWLNTPHNNILMLTNTKLRLKISVTNVVYCILIVQDHSIPNILGNITDNIKLISVWEISGSHGNDWRVLSSGMYYVMPCHLVEAYQHSGGRNGLCSLAAWLLVWLVLWPWMWRQ
jgi:hypothetical protein